jgi:hypothetical protein
MRGKDQYTLEQDGNKSVVKKLGVGAKQRDGFEYEFTASFLIDQLNNLAITQKDNTHLFETRGYIKLSESDGKEIIEWANSGDAEYVAPKRYEEAIAEIKAEQEVGEEEEALDELREIIINLAKTIGGQKDKDLMTVMRKYTPTGNPNKITDLAVAQKLYDEMALLWESKQESK